MFRLSRIGLALVLLGAVGFASLPQTAAAADDAANVIKYRKQVMVANASHITAIFSVLKGETSYAGHIAAHARAIADGAAMMPDIFPEGSGSGDTGALPSIWQDWPKFQAAAKALQTAAADLAAAASSGDIAAVGAAAGAVGKACGGCHEPFRKKK
ncbi:MAG: cytochrome c [Rhodospirillaceae bacterium]|jgi:cytochrome c556|nr:cytochrome c [Rhodospirillaceae bacterium]MBT5037486.1 cytochrome c [Rhodospirillaceae bacterium]MBT5674778.1 cytochrome c [Rhodospirillaceae bacterium]MBT5780177.1 cytochrome c [Rhodospirillaceae bacterium]MBT7290991.1 cytochrome c [Rhodospirillaceae bacterium]